MKEAMTENFGDEAMKIHIKKYAEEYAIAFCKDFQEERKWCFQNKIDYRNLPEEKLFQEYCKEFDFKAKRRQIALEIICKQQDIIRRKNIHHSLVQKRIDQQLTYNPERKRRKLDSLAFE